MKGDRNGKSTYLELVLFQKTVCLSAETSKAQRLAEMYKSHTRSIIDPL